MSTICLWGVVGTLCGSKTFLFHYSFMMMPLLYFSGRNIYEKIKVYKKTYKRLWKQNGGHGFISCINKRLRFHSERCSNYLKQKKIFSPFSRFYIFWLQVLRSRKCSIINLRAWNIKVSCNIGAGEEVVGGFLYCWIVGVEKKNVKTVKFYYENQRNGEKYSCSTFYEFYEFGCVHNT